MPIQPPAGFNPSTKADKVRTITGGGLVTGGGDLSQNRVLTVTEANQAQAEAGTASNVAMTPRRVAQQLAAWYATLATVVKTTGAQVISGVKTFTSSPRSTGTPTQDTDILNRIQHDFRHLRVTRGTDAGQTRERREYFFRGSTTSGDIGEWGWSSNIGAGGTLAYGYLSAFAAGRTVQLTTGTTANTVVEIRRALGLASERSSILTMFLAMNPVAWGSNSPIANSSAWFGWDNGDVTRFVMAGWDTSVSPNIYLRVRGSDDAVETTINTGIPVASMAPPYTQVQIVLDVIGSFMNVKIFGNPEQHQIRLYTSVNGSELQLRYTASVAAQAIYGASAFCRLKNLTATDKSIEIMGVELVHGPGTSEGQH